MEDNPISAATFLTIFMGAEKIKLLAFHSYYYSTNVKKIKKSFFGNPFLGCLVAGLSLILLAKSILSVAKVLRRRF